MLDRPRSEVALEYWLPTPFASFPFTSPPVRHRVPPGSERALNTSIVTKEPNELQPQPPENLCNCVSLINITFRLRGFVFRN